METTKKLELLAPELLTAHEKNARRHSQRQLKQLRASLKEFGFVSPVLVDASGRIIAGHAMVEAAKAEHMAAVPCVRVEHLTEQQLQAYMIADNRLAENARWDDALLEESLRELFEAGFDLSLTGFGEYRLADIGTDIPPEASTTDDAAEAGICHTGDLWELGDHRLLCGDATKRDDLMRLMRGDKATLLLTDPPYNVDYHGKTEASLTIANDNMDDAAFVHFLTDAFCAAHEVLLPGGAFYIWHSATYAAEFIAACRSAQLDIRQHLVWVKNQFVLGRQDYNWQHECCLYGWDGRAPHRWYGGDGQSTTLLFDRPSVSEDHPTMKPVELFARQVRNSTRKGDIVLDSFCGSGTAILASEMYGRRCRAVELLPHNCDVILRRWEEQSGRKAKLLEGGERNGGC